MTNKKPPLPARPKEKRKPSAIARANRFAYLTNEERAWIAGVVDMAGQMQAMRIRNPIQKRQFLSYRMVIRYSARTNHVITLLGEILRLPANRYGSERAQPKLELPIPHEQVDDFIEILRPHLTAESLNYFIRYKYLADLSKFKLETAGWDYREQNRLNGKPVKHYKGVDWGKIDEVLNAPEVTNTIKERIATGMGIVHSRIERSKDQLEG